MRFIARYASHNMRQVVAPLSLAGWTAVVYDLRLVGFPRGPDRPGSDPRIKLSSAAKAECFGDLGGATRLALSRMRRPDRGVSAHLG